MTTLPPFAGIMNELGSSGRPFLFVIDFLMQRPLVIPLDQVDATRVLYSVNGNTNAGHISKTLSKTFFFEKTPPDFNHYSRAFDIVMKHLQYGNSFLLNLTMPTAIRTNLSLKEIFYRSNAAYKLWVNDEFVVFSPELFIRISDGQIESHPMKGTIDASLLNAEQQILNDPKETAEHHTIVDLIRNDLNSIAENVRVEKFRFITEINTSHKKLLQVSSSVVGELGQNYHQQIGTLLYKLLPAGSISGAPKKKTVEIILEAEQYPRGYYTGIFGIFDGHNLDSGVMIRFIEKSPNGYQFKSGGGITINSRCRNEYNELIDKVYLPFS
jgi:para-aminobenzoate synthetase component I